MLLLLFLCTCLSQKIQIVLNNITQGNITLQPFQELQLTINLTLDSSINITLPIVEVFADEASMAVPRIEGMPGDQLALKIFCASSNNVSIRIGVNSQLISYNLSFIAQGVLSNPNRAEYGTWMQFPIVLSFALLQPYLLPFNMPTTASITIDRVDIPTSYAQYSDDSFWQSLEPNDEISTVAIPWLPFFAQCENYGNHIYLYDLIEQNENCTLVDPADVLVVQTIPSTGFNAIGDQCYIELQCSYVETFPNSYSGNLWWQSQGQTLFYIVSQAVDVSDFVGNKDNFLGQMFLNLITGQNNGLVEVVFNTAGVSMSTIPSSYELLIKYNQVSQTQKLLYSAVVTSTGYQTVTQNQINNYTLTVRFEPMTYLDLVNGFQFATPIYVALILGLGIFTVLCIILIWFLNRLLSSIEHPPKLRIVQTFLTAFIPPIIGSILTTIPVMILLLLIDVGFSTMFSSITFKSDPNVFSPAQTLLFNYGRAGLMIAMTGMILINFGASLLIDLPTEEVLQKIKQTVVDKQNDNRADVSVEEEADEKQQSNTHEKRISGILERRQSRQNPTQSMSPPKIILNEIQRKNSIMDNGPYTRQSSQVFQPKQLTANQSQIVPKHSIFRKVTKKIEPPQSPRSAENANFPNIELIGDTSNQEQLQPVLRQNSKSPTNLREPNFSDYPLEQEQNGEDVKRNGRNNTHISEDAEMDEEEIVAMLKSKRTHYQTIQFFTAGFLMVLVGFSYMQLFYQNIFYFIIILQFVDVAFAWILQKYLLSESLLIQPLMVALEVIQFVMFLAAESFQDFIVSYIIRIALIIFFRTYITPILKNLEFFSRKLATWASIRYPKVQPYLRNFLVSSIKDKYTRFYLGTHSEESVEFQEQQSIEHVITMVLAFSSKMHAIFLKPFVLIIIKIFQTQTQIPTLYNIKFINFDFYIYFAILMIIPQILIDIYVLNSIELIYGYKLYDYFDYCAYRNSIKSNNELHQVLQLDQSISMEHRSIDNKLFTHNFYFNGSMVVYGILLVMIGVTIIIQQNFKAFEDPVVYFFIIFLMGSLFTSKFLITYIWNRFKVSKIHKKSKNLDSLHEFLNPVKENLEQIMEVDVIRKNFITLNKVWIIQNLHLFIGQENFSDNGEFLLKTYEYLQNEEKIIQREKKRAEMLFKKQKEEELKSRKKQFQKQDKSMIDEEEPLKTRTYDQQVTDLQQQVENTSNPIPTNMSNKLEVTGQQSETIIRLNRPQVDRLKKMLFIWFYQGRQNLYLKSIVNEILEQNLDQQCNRCGLDIEIKIVEQVPFYKMANSFKYKTLGTPFNKFEWKRYYQRHQKFITLCNDCEIEYKLKITQIYKQTVNLQDKTISQKKRIQANRLSKGIVIKWLFMARSNILFKKE